MEKEGNEFRDSGRHSLEMPAPDAPNLVVVIPALNESKSIGAVLDETSKAFSGIEHSIVVVDGSSTDDTREVAAGRGAKVIDQQGIGYGDALLTGFLYARDSLDADLIAMMDGDLTYNPKDILVLMNKIVKDKADLVVGNRFERMEKGAMPFINRIGNRFLSWMARVFLKLRIYDTQCGLRALRGNLVDQLRLTNEGMPFAIEMLAAAKSCGARISEAPVSYRPRSGRSKLSPLKDGLRIFGTILRLIRDTRPLPFFGGIGTVLGLGGIALGLDVALQWSQTGRVVRLASVMFCVLLLMGAMQFFTIGLVADMIKGLKREDRQIRKCL
jgi:glycosyltransferase involved in cell wall biosynthesis